MDRPPPCPHPAIAGRERELADLTEGVRRLVRSLNRAVPPPATARAVEAGLAAVVAELEARIPDPPPDRLYLGDVGGGRSGGAPYDVVHGPYNPVAPPLTMSVDGDEAVGSVTFDATYEGPPGRVHGAVIIGAFDMVCSAANGLAGAVGPTASLRVSYESATRTGRPVEFRARQVDVDGRRIRTAGELRQDGKVTCRADAVFIALDRDALARLRRSS